MNDPNKVEATQLRDPSPLWPWMRTFIGIDCILFAALTATGVFASLILSYVIRFDAFQLQSIASMMSYVQLANVFFFLGGAYFTTWVVHRMTTNAHLLAPDRVKRPADSIGGRLSLMMSFVFSPMPLAQLWRSTFGTGPLAETRVQQITWCWRVGFAAVLASMGAAALRGFDPSFGSKFVVVATALSTLSYALGAACGSLLIGIFGRLAKAQQLLIRRSISGKGPKD